MLMFFWADGMTGHLKQEPKASTEGRSGLLADTVLPVGAASP